MAFTRVHLYITGRVQGVFFRAWVQQRARGLGISGWVRNLSDGRVEAVFEGEAGLVQQMVELCHDGPQRARVDTVLDDYSEAPAGLSGFELRPTA